MRPRLSFTFLLHIFSIHLALSNAAFDWQSYDQCAWSALNASFPSSCGNGENISSTACLCDSSQFLTEAMKGIAKDCGCTVLDNSATVAYTICTYYRMPIAMTPSEMVATGSHNGKFCPTLKPSSTPSASNAKNGGGAGLSAGTVAVISVISSLATVVGAACTIWYKWREKQKKRKEEALKLEQGSMTSTTGSGGLTTAPSGVSNATNTSVVNAANGGNTPAVAAGSQTP